MRFLGLDLGTKTLGVSLSDKDNLMALPLVTLHFQSEKYEELIPMLKKIIIEKQITDIVLGLPKNMDNSLGFAALRSENFAKLLKENFSLPVHLIDERLSTIYADRLLMDTKKNHRQRKEVVDNIASCIILDTYLRKRNMNNE